VALLFDSTADVSGTELLDNTASGGGDYSYGGALYLESRCSARLVNAPLRSNAAVNGGRQSAGGAVALVFDSTVDVSGTELLDNTASGGGEYSLGGALYLESNCSARLVNASLRSNAAVNGGLESAGGALYLLSQCSARLVNASVTGNVAGRAKIAQGGACFVDDRSVLTVLDSTLGNNSALDGTQHSRGGAIGAVGPTTVLLERTRLVDNAASSNRSGAPASGGALYAGTLL
jgi:hypothetical protein